MVWSNQLVLEFLELYEKESAIWNPKDPKHKNRKFVEDSWQRIADNFSLPSTVDELKKKKASLMSMFRKLATRVWVSKQTAGSGTEDVYKPEWFAYEIMAKFLHGIFQPRINQNTEVLSVKIKTTVDESNEGNDQQGCEQYEVQNNEDAQTMFKIPSSTKKRKATNISLIQNRMEDAYNIFKKVSTEPIRDEYSIYAELLAKKLRALDENTRETAMHEIDNYLFRIKNNRNQLHQQDNSLSSTHSFQNNTPYSHAFQTYSSQLLHNQLPKEYPTLSSVHGPSQENLVISPQNLPLKNLGFEYSYRPKYASSPNSP